VGVFAEDGRHLGFVTLLSDDPASFTPEHGDLLGRLRPLVARALDRLPSLAAFGRLVGDALGATVVTGGGRCLPVPGLPRHPLLFPGSPVLTVAQAHAGTRGARSTFLCRALSGSAIAIQEASKGTWRPSSCSIAWARSGSGPCMSAISAGGEPGLLS
jgi:hypothetical protein